MQEFKQLIGRKNEYFSSIRNLDPENKCPALLFHEEILQPGRRSSNTHYHSKKQECVFLMEGELHIVMGDKKVLIKAGESFSFPPEQTPHYMENLTDKEARYISVAAEFKGDKTVFTEFPGL